MTLSSFEWLLFLPSHSKKYNCSRSRPNSLQPLNGFPFFRLAWLENRSTCHILIRVLSKSFSRLRLPFKGRSGWGAASHVLATKKQGPALPKWRARVFRHRSLVFISKEPKIYKVGAQLQVRFTTCHHWSASSKN